MATLGTLSGVIAIPNTVAPIEITANLKTMDTSVAVAVDAPETGRSTTRLNWLLRQLRSAPDSLRIDAAFERTKIRASALLGDVRSDPKAVLAGTDRRPRSFTVARTGKMGTKRRTGSGSFVGDVEQLVDEFYREVVQGLRAWTPPAPRLAEEKSVELEEPPVAEAAATPSEADS